MNNDEARKIIEYLLPLALRKCPESSDAEDIVQETVLAALTFTAKGNVIADPKAWLRRVMERKFYDMLRRKYSQPKVSIDEDFVLCDAEDFVSDMIRREDSEDVRRQVSYLSESYRTVITKYYFYDESIKDIALSMGLKEGTVKSRLDFGRKQLKKGIENMEKYSENSFAPEKLGIGWSGSAGTKYQPMSVIQEDLIAQNLLLLAYEKPLTVSDLSRAVGIPAAYAEPVAEKLVKEELMKRMGDGKVYTDFIIYEQDDFTKYEDEQIKFARDNADKYIDALKSAVAKLKKTDFYSLRLERYMMIKIAHDGFYIAETANCEPMNIPDRPDGGKWLALGIKGSDTKTENRKKYGIAGERTACVWSFLGKADLEIHNFETALYGRDKYSFEGWSGINALHLLEIEGILAKLFYVIKKDIKPETADIDRRIIEGIPYLREEGYISTENGKNELLIPCLTHKQNEEFISICNGAAKQFGESVSKEMGDYLKCHIKNVPAHLKSVSRMHMHYPYAPYCMELVYEAIRTGVHPEDLGVCPETYIVLD